MKKTKSGVKGAPSGFVISLLVHAAAFMLAGLLVVFNVVQKEEKKFVPPKPVDRPKMKLKKPKVKVKKTAKPKSTTRIVTKVKKASMPDIQLPEMSGIGDGLAGDIGGFDIMPDLSEVTLFGGGSSIGNDFEGTFYDLKRTRSGRPYHGMDPSKFMETVTEFVRGGWKTSTLSKFYRSPRKLYATSFMVPTVQSSAAPTAFGEPDTGGWCWMAHYKGQLVHKEGITFRFRGQGDDLLVVRVDGEIVLNGSWPGADQTLSRWQSNHAKNRTYRLGNNYAVIGDWITLEPGIPLDMEVICGEVPGGEFDMMLVVEVEGEEYELNAQQGPILPMFKTAVPTHDLCDRIFETLIEGECSVTGGPVFNDFSSGGKIYAAKQEAAVAPEPPLPSSAMRLWTMDGGNTLEAEFISSMGDKVILRTSKGRMVKLPADEVSADDRKYIALGNPPELNISFSKQSSQRVIEPSPFHPAEVARALVWNFGAKLKQMSTTEYNFPLTVEIYAIGQSYFDDRKYVLLDRQTTTFTPTKENGRSHAFKSERRVELLSFNMHEQAYGHRYKTYLVTVKDIRGEIIQYETPNNWLFEHLGKLDNIGIGHYFDRACNRVYPTGPKRYY